MLQSLATSTFYQLPIECDYQCDEDLELFVLNGLFHWEGLESDEAEFDYSDYCSEDGFETIEEAVADAVYALQRVDGETHQQAVAYVQQQGLPINSIQEWSPEQ